MNRRFDDIGVTFDGTLKDLTNQIWKVIEERGLISQRKPSALSDAALLFVYGNIAEGRERHPAIYAVALNTPTNSVYKTKKIWERGLSDHKLYLDIIDTTAKDEDDWDIK